MGGSSSTDDHQWWMHWNDNSYGQYYTWSNSFTVVADLYNFLMLDIPGGYYEGTAHTLTEQEELYTPASMVKGDVLFYDWNGNGSQDHAGIQVGIGTDNVSGYYGNYADLHSNPHYHSFWSLLPYNAQWPSTVITFVHVSASNP